MKLAKMSDDLKDAAREASRDKGKLSAFKKMRHEAQEDGEQVQVLVAHRD